MFSPQRGQNLAGIDWHQWSMPARPVDFLLVICAAPLAGAFIVPFEILVVQRALYYWDKDRQTHRQTHRQTGKHTDKKTYR